MQKVMQKKLLACWACLALFLAAGAVAEETAAEGERTFVWYSYESGLGADGYDVVAYFDGGGGLRGEARFAVEFSGLWWHFTTAARRDAFIAAPEKYVPQYGGHCAYAASKSAIAFGDPDAWTVHDGKLYFNYDKSVRAKWEPGVDENVAKGDIYWRDSVEAEARREARAEH